VLPAFLVRTTNALQKEETRASSFSESPFLLAFHHGFVSLRKDNKSECIQ